MQEQVRSKSIGRAHDQLSEARQISKIRNLELSQLTRPFWAVFVIGFASLIVFSGVATMLLDQNSIRNSERAFGSIIDDRSKSLQVILFEYSYWDDAVSNLVVSPNSAWIQDNIVEHTYENLNVTQVMQFDGSGELVLSSARGELRDHKQDEIGQLTSLRNLVKAARKSLNGTTPQPLSGFIAGRSALYMAAASRMVNYVGDEDQMTDHVLVFLQEMDSATVSEIAEKYPFDGLGLSKAESGFFQGCFDVLDFDGELLGRFIWNPNLSGNSLLPYLAVVIIVIFASMVWSSNIFVSRARMVLQELEGAKIQSDLAQHVLRQQAMIDPETNLNNLRSFQLRFDEVSRDGKNRGAGGLISLELQVFDELSDRQVQPVGNHLLSRFGGMLVDLVSDESTVFRIGGSEFAILDPTLSASDLTNLAEQISALSAQPVRYEGRSYLFSPVLGTSKSNKPDHWIREANNSRIRARVGH